MKILTLYFILIFSICSARMEVRIQEEVVQVNLDEPKDSKITESEVVEVNLDEPKDSKPEKSKEIISDKKEESKSKKQELKKELKQELIELQKFKNDCEAKSEEEAQLCLLILDLEKALLLLENIQKNNLEIIKEKANPKNEQKEAQDLGKKEIKVVTQEEHETLEFYMNNFCQNLKKLHDDEKKMLFLLTWNKRLIFENEKKINKFCKKID